MEHYLYFHQHQQWCDYSHLLLILLPIDGEKNQKSESKKWVTERNVLLSSYLHFLPAVLLHRHQFQSSN